MDDIQFIVEFEELAGDAEIPEDTTVANLAIFAGDDCLTRNRPRRQRLGNPVEEVYGPIAGLVDWMIDHWGPILWELHTPFRKSRTGEPDALGPPLPGVAEAYDHWNRDLDEDSDLAVYADWHHRHQLGHAASDLALPSIMILPEDRNVVLSVDRLPQSMQATVEFLQPDGQTRAPTLFVCNKTSFRQEAKNFINLTLARAKSDSKFACWTDWLVNRWETAQAEEENYGRRLSWMLGDLGARRIEELRTNQPSLEDGLRQLLQDCKIVTEQAELHDAEKIVDEFALKPDTRFSRGEAPGWQGVGQENISLSLPEFTQGYQLARLLRKKLALQGGAVGELHKALKRLDVELEDEMATPLFRVAVCASKGSYAHIIPSSLDPRMGGELGARFAIASALGRLLWQSRRAEERICAAQGDQAMQSQSRRANAFAAEFLLPREAVENVRPDDYAAIGRLSERYSISPSAAKWHVHNVAKNSDSSFT